MTSTLSKLKYCVKKTTIPRNVGIRIYYFAYMNSRHEQLMYINSLSKCPLYFLVAILKIDSRGLPVATAVFCHACKRDANCFFLMPYKAVDYVCARDRCSYHHPHQNQHQLNQYNVY